MLRWEERLQGKSNKEKVCLHVERWNAWDNFISEFAKGKQIVTEVDDMTIDVNEKEFQTLLQKEKTHWSKKKVDNVIFDASFGSLNSTSDLDINVLSNDTNVLIAWIKYIKQWQKKNKGQTFTNFFDSNFYFEPCDDSLVSLKLNLINDITFKWTTDESYKGDFDAVKTYTDAYENNTDIDGIFPNPMNLTPDQETFYYERCETLAKNVFFATKNNNHDEIRKAFLQLSCCKIEGIVSICALAICGVFGRDIMIAYKNKEIPIHPKALEIGVYEMLRNLKMHSHTDNDGNRLFKSKYANRLINLLANDASICPKNKVVNLEKTNNAGMQYIKSAMVFIMDYLDGDACNMKIYESVNYNIDTVINMMKNRILKESTSKEDPMDLIRSFTQLKLRF